jgi:hypothetical protein
MDRYPVMVDVQARNRKPAQADEARFAFETLVQAMPEVPPLLVHQVTKLVAAHLPGTGTHYFGPDVTSTIQTSTLAPLFRDAVERNAPAQAAVGSRISSWAPDAPGWQPRHPGGGAPPGTSTDPDQPRRPRQ